MTLEDPEDPLMEAAETEEPSNEIPDEKDPPNLRMPAMPSTIPEEYDYTDDLIVDGVDLPVDRREAERAVALSQIMENSFSNCGSSLVS
jgi:hypothetical protein